MAENNGVRCPKCGDEMRLRKGRYGDFFGCVNYPRCLGTLPKGYSEGYQRIVDLLKKYPTRNAGRNHVVRPHYEG